MRYYEDVAEDYCQECGALLNQRMVCTCGHIIDEAEFLHDEWEEQ